MCIYKIECDPDIFFCKNYIKRTLLVLEKHWSCEYDIIYLNSVMTVLFLYKKKIKKLTPFTNSIKVFLHYRLVIIKLIGDK